MKPIIDYCIIKGPDIHSLASTVGEYLAKGWEPQGGVVMSDWKGWAQAMILHAPEGD